MTVWKLFQQSCSYLMEQHDTDIGYDYQECHEPATRFLLRHSQMRHGRNEILILRCPEHYDHDINTSDVIAGHLQELTQEELEVLRVMAT